MAAIATALMTRAERLSSIVNRITSQGYGRDVCRVNKRMPRSDTEPHIWRQQT